MNDMLTELMISNLITGKQPNNLDDTVRYCWRYINKASISPSRAFSFILLVPVFLFVAVFISSSVGDDKYLELPLRWGLIVHSLSSDGLNMPSLFLSEMKVASS